MSRWMLIDTGLDDLVDLRRAEFWVFDVEGERPTEEELDEAISRLLRGIDLRTRAKVWLLPGDAKCLGIMRPKVTYEKIEAPQ